MDSGRPQKGHESNTEGEDEPHRLIMAALLLDFATYV